MSWIRPVIALMAMGGLLAGFFLDKVSAEAFIGIASVSITWWFKSRDEAKGTK